MSLRLMYTLFGCQKRGELNDDQKENWRRQCSRSQRRELLRRSSFLLLPIYDLSFFCVKECLDNTAQHLGDG